MGFVIRVRLMLFGLGVLLLPAVASADAAGDDEAERLVQRLAAARAPNLPLTKRCYTDAFTEAYQALPTLVTEQRKPIEDLLGPPSDLSHFVETAGAFPVRVSFADPSLQSKAEQILDTIAVSYAKQVGEWGFWPPIVEEGADPYRVYLMDAGGAAGYTSPYLDNPATPHNDAFSYIVIDPQLDGLQLDATVAHEFNHACQVAMDASELRSFMENTASYIEVAVLPSSIPLVAAMFPYFQSQPFRPLEYRLSIHSDGYEYGGALWPMFLTHYYGDGDPVWLRRVWEASVQEGFMNEPDYFDALDTVLIEDGGIDGGIDGGGVRDAARTFARYRFFVGNYADGYHLPNAEYWGGAEVWVSAEWTANDMPVLDREPFDASTRPQPNGCNYITMNPDGDNDYPIKFSFDGAMSVPWHVSVLEIAAGKESVDTPVELDDEGHGSVAIDASALQRLVLVVCQSTDGDYDPDYSNWGAANYRYSISYDAPAPTIVSVTPDELPLGAHDVELTVDGSGFAHAPGFSVDLGEKHTVLKLVKFVSSEQLIVKATIAPDAELGPHALTVTNPGGAHAVTMVDFVAPLADEPVDDVSSGCACDLASAPPSRGWLLFLLAGLLPLARRRSGCKGSSVGIDSVGPDATGIAGLGSLR